eukprot:scaffold11624_cov18-Tisochrysis_lutea.AAC.3
MDALNEHNQIPSSQNACLTHAFMRRNTSLLLRAHAVAHNILVCRYSGMPGWIHEHCHGTDRGATLNGVFHKLSCLAAGRQ